MTFQILSLSGGGYLGLYTAAVIAGVEKLTGRPLLNSFDLIAGTSVGGIIALGLSKGASGDQIRSTFLTHGNKIFSAAPPPQHSLKAWLKVVSGLPRARYNPAPLRDVINLIVGDGARMSDLKRPTVVTAINLTKGGPKVFKTGHHPSLIRDWRLPVVDVALATSAAPTYFPIHQIGSELYADGGLVANSPDLIAVHEAEQFLNVKRADIRVLSIGTTTASFSFSSNIKKNLGSGGWMRRERLTNAMIGSQQALTHDMMRHILQDRYVRIDHVRSGEQLTQLALDCASDAAQTDLQACAAASIAEVSSNAVFRQMILNDVPKFKFYNATI